jgi:hypothetical protein
VIPGSGERRRGRAIVPVTAALVLALVLGLASLSPRAATLRLKDGRVLEGVDVRRDGNEFLLHLEGGAVIPVPVQLVEEVGLSAKRPEPPEQVPGLTYTEPQQLAGTPVEPPRTEEQLAVLGPPAQFQPDVVRPTLQPSYWVPDPEQHNWAPSKWAEGPIDPDWQPTNAFDPDKDVLAEGRSTWRKAPIDSSWTPTDGFKK